MRLYIQIFSILVSCSCSFVAIPTRDSKQSDYAPKDVITLVNEIDTIINHLQFTLHQAYYHKPIGPPPGTEDALRLVMKKLADARQKLIDFPADVPTQVSQLAAAIDHLVSHYISQPPDESSIKQLLNIQEGILDVLNTTESSDIAAIRSTFKSFYEDTKRFHSEFLKNGVTVKWFRDYFNAYRANSVKFADIAESVKESIKNISSTLTKIHSGSTDPSFINQILYGHPDPPKLEDKKDLKKFYLFDGFVGAIEGVLKSAFSLLVDDLLKPLFETIVKFLFDVLKAQLSIIIKIILAVLYALLPVVDTLVKIIIYLLEAALYVVFRVYSVIDSKIYLTESLLAFTFVFYKTRDLWLALYLTGGLMILVNVSRLHQDLSQVLLDDSLHPQIVRYFKNVEQYIN